LALISELDTYRVHFGFVDGHELKKQLKYLKKNYNFA